jgi:hypothetical protein
LPSAESGSLAARFGLRRRCGVEMDLEDAIRFVRDNLNMTLFSD